MKETAKSIKLYANVIIVATATVGAFLISPSNAVKNLNEALEELRTLRSTIDMTSDYHTEIKNKLGALRFLELQKAMSPNEKMPTSTGSPTVAPAEMNSSVADANMPDSTILEQPSPESLVFDAHETNGNTGTRLVKVTWIDSPLSKHARIDVTQPTNWGACLPFKCDIPSESVTVSTAHSLLVQIDADRSRPEFVQVFEPRIEDFAKRFRGLLSHYHNSTLQRWRIVPPRIDAIAACEESRCLPEMARLEMELIDNKSAIRVCTAVSGRWQCSSCDSIEMPSFASFLADKHPVLLAQLKTPIDAKRNAWLPASHRFWSEIGPKELDEAITIIENRIASIKERITLFGLSASIRSASIAFPVSIAALLWISMLHLEYLLVLLSEKAEDPISACEEWFGFFPNSTATISSHLLVSLFPLIIYLLLTTHPQGLTEVEWRQALACGALLLLTSVSHVRLLGKVQATLRTVDPKSRGSSVPTFIA